MDTNATTDSMAPVLKKMIYGSKNKNTSKASKKNTYKMAMEKNKNGY